MLPQRADVSAVAQILSSFPLSILCGSPAPHMESLTFRSSLLSYIPLATASQVHLEVHLLGDSKLSRAGIED